MCLVLRNDLSTTKKGVTLAQKGSLKHLKNVILKNPPWIDIYGLCIPPIPIGSMYAIYGNIYHQYTPNVSIFTIHGSYGIERSSYN